jgi:GTP cyclohydrolase IA
VSHYQSTRRAPSAKSIGGSDLTRVKDSPSDDILSAPSQSSGGSSNVTSTDANLGRAVHEILAGQGLETPMVGFPRVPDRRTIENMFEGIMRQLALDLSNDSLQQTPRRVAKMFKDEIFYGLDYDNFPRCSTVENKMAYDEMVAVKCTVKSVCEHHFVPFIGIAHVAYLPRNAVLGLSKFNRVVDFFSRRPQIQERLTEQISAALCYILQTDDVAVVIQAKHFCVALRGVQDHVSDTTTSKVKGRFKSVPELRAEFLALTKSNGVAS